MLPPLQTRIPTSSSRPSTPPLPASTSSPSPSPPPYHPPYNPASPPAPAPSWSQPLRRQKSNNARTASAPYMVALSGWPEPVYVSPSSDFEARRRSRPSSPRPSFSAAPSNPNHHRGSSASVPAPAAEGASSSAPSDPPKESILSLPCMYSFNGGVCTLPNHPDHIQPYHSSNPSLPKHLRSALPRTAPPPPPLSALPPQSASQDRPPPLRHGTFADPRLAPNVAVLSNRGALPLSPSWSTSAAPTSPSSKVRASNRGAGVLVMRAVPDVYPPPVMGKVNTGVALAGMAGVATEVYPRDPNSPLLWGQAGRAAGEGDREAMDVEGGQDGPGNKERDMDVDR